MGKPTQAEIDTALAEAGRLRETGEDEHHLAKAFMNAHYRLHLLEEVYRECALYLHGEDARQHARLKKAVEAYREYENHPG